MSNFFEKLLSSDTKLWSKPDITCPDEIKHSTRTCIMPQSFKSSQSDDSIKQIVFLFNQGFLYSTKKKGAVLSGVLDLNYAYVEVKSVEDERDPGVKYSLSIERRNRYTTIYLKEKRCL